MTSEEQAKQEAWLRKHVSDDEPGGLMAIGRHVLDAMFPHPDATRITPDQAASARADREARVRAFLDSAGGSPLTPRVPVQFSPVTPPEVPAS